ncbi:MAG: hypothetical protein AB8F95_18990, partial [Bacteroidia bacterium]
MKTLLLAVGLMLTQLTIAQEITPVHIHQYTLQPPATNLDEVKDFPSYAGSQYVMINFSSVPSADQHKALTQLGVQLFEYFPSNTFSAKAPEGFDFSSLKGFDVHAVFEIPTAFKKHVNLTEKGVFPGWAYDQH